jgi:hypothetical protein
LAAGDQGVQSARLGFLQELAGGVPGEVQPGVKGFWGGVVNNAQFPFGERQGLGTKGSENPKEASSIRRVGGEDDGEHGVRSRLKAEVRSPKSEVRTGIT